MELRELTAPFQVSANSLAMIDASMRNKGVGILSGKQHPGSRQDILVIWSSKGRYTIVGIEPHPNDAKSNAYKKIILSQMGKELN